MLQIDKTLSPTDLSSVLLEIFFFAKKWKKWAKNWKFSHKLCAIFVDTHIPLKNKIEVFLRLIENPRILELRNLERLEQK